MSKNDISRRRLMQLTGAAALASDPLVQIASYLLNAPASIARAATEQAKTYVYLQQAGAPARWMFDLFLNPENSSKFVRNAQVGTEFVAVNGRYTNVRYRLINIGGVWVPPIWNYDLPVANGTSRLRTLLPHITHIRGINTRNAGHPFCQAAHFRPLGANTTTNALTSDADASVFPSINIACRNYVYLSAMGHNEVTLPSNGNLIQHMLTPFLPEGSAAFKANATKLDNELYAAQQALNEASTMAAQNKVLLQTNATARKLITMEFGDFEQEWQRLKNKYNDIIARAIRTQYPFINDKPIGTPNARGRQYENHVYGIIRTADLRTLIKNTTTVKSLAERFAALEFIIVKGLSPSITIGLDRIVNLGPTNIAQYYDEHNVGMIPSLFFNVLNYAALGGCLLELVNVLKAEGLFENTVIDVGAEFNRMPRNDGTGSDHGWEGASVMLITGDMRQGPFIFGNITNDGTPTYRGTWGKGAATLGGAPLNIGHFASTLAALLGTPSPITATGSLLKKAGNEWRAKIGRGKLV